MAPKTDFRRSNWPVMYSNSSFVLPSVGNRYVTELRTDISGNAAVNKNTNKGTIILYMFLRSHTLHQIIIMQLNVHRGV
jgi:hypothetical protein